MLGNGLVTYMKIPDIKGLVSIARTMLDPQKAQQAMERAQETAKTDKVELSSQGQAVHKLAAERTDERVRAEVVAKLQADYARGELETDAAATAEAMVGDGLFDDIIEGK